jgi:hypothetical protein
MEIFRISTANIKYKKSNSHVVFSFSHFSLPMLKFQFPRKHTQNTSEPQLVDSLQVVQDSLIATKCALHGVIYLWDLMATLSARGNGQGAITVTPIRVLSWSSTDNYFMNIGCHPGESNSKLVPVGSSFTIDIL